MTTGFFETPLYATLSEAFGYMNDAGYCATGGVCKNFPLLLEIGSPLTSLNDQLMMESLANYMTLNGLGKLPAFKWACRSKSQQRQQSYCILQLIEYHSVASLTGTSACTWICCHMESRGHLHVHAELHFVALGLQRPWPALPNVWLIAGCTNYMVHTYMHIVMLQLLAMSCDVI